MTPHLIQDALSLKHFSVQSAFFELKKDGGSKICKSWENEETWRKVLH